MRKSALLVASALIGATCVAPAAYARHRVHRAAAHMMAAPGVMDQNGNFYATPMSATGIAAPGLGFIPGIGLATGVFNGVAQPILAPGAGGGIVLPGLDAAGGIVNGVTQPILGPLS